MSQPIPLRPLYSLFTNISVSVSLEEGPVQTDLADFVKSLRLASAAPAPVAPSLGPRTRAGDRRWDRSHLIEQLVGLHTTCQLCPYISFFCHALIIFAIFLSKATYNIYLCHLAKRFSDLIDQIMIFTRKTSNFLCFDKIGPDKL